MPTSTKNKSVHVVPSDSGWRVVRPNASRASAVTATKSSAVDKAKTMAKNDRTSVYVHRNDGKITSVESFPKKAKQTNPSSSGKWTKSTVGQATGHSTKSSNKTSSRSKK